MPAKLSLSLGEEHFPNVFLLLCQSGAVGLCPVQQAGIASGRVWPARDPAVSHF